MSRIDGSALMFDEEEVRETTDPGLPRLIRVIFFGLSITNNGYLERYHSWFKDNFRDKNRKEFSQKSTADRKTLLERKKLTYTMLRHVVKAMGYDIESVTVRLKDRISGDSLTFSTDDTVEDLKRVIEESKSIGIQSFL